MNKHDQDGWMHASEVDSFIDSYSGVVPCAVISLSGFSRLSISMKPAEEISKDLDLYFFPLPNPPKTIAEMVGKIAASKHFDSSVIQ